MSFLFGLMLGILWPVWLSIPWRIYRGIRHAVAEQRLIVFHDAPLLAKARIAVSDFIFGFCNPNVHIWEEESRARRLRREADYKGPGEVQKPEQLPMPPPPLYGRNGPPPPKDPNRKTNPPSPPPPPKRNYHYVDVTVRHIGE